MKRRYLWLTLAVVVPVVISLAIVKACAQKSASRERAREFEAPNQAFDPSDVYLDAEQRLMGMIAAPDGSAVLAVDDRFGVWWIGQRDKNGIERWRTRIDQGPGRSIELRSLASTEMSIVAYLAVTDSRKLTKSSHGIVAAFDSKTGLARWHIDAPSSDGLLVLSRDGNRVAVSKRERGHLVADEVGIVELSSGSVVRRSSDLEDDEEFFTRERDVATTAEREVLAPKVKLVDGSEPQLAYAFAQLLGVYREQTILGTQLSKEGASHPVVLMIPKEGRARAIPLSDDTAFSGVTSIKQSLARRDQQIDRFLVVEGEDRASIVDLERASPSGVIAKAWMRSVDSATVVVNSSHIVRIDSVTGEAVALKLADGAYLSADTLRQNTIWVGTLASEPLLRIERVDVKNMMPMFGTGLVSSSHVRSER